MEDYGLIGLLPGDVYAMEKEWLVSALSLPDVTRLFTQIERDEAVAELDYELAYSVNELADRDFIENVLAVGMVLSWTSVRLRSSLNLTQMYGGKEEKFYSQ